MGRFIITPKRLLGQDGTEVEIHLEAGERLDRFLDRLGDGTGAGPAGPAGDPGASAYELWLGQGGQGDVATFLNQLKGETGASIDVGGDYYLNQDYGSRQLVRYNDATWLSIQDVPGPYTSYWLDAHPGLSLPTSQAPGEDGGMFWRLIARDGTKGDTGDPGIGGLKGDTGSTGLTGDPGAKGDKGDKGDLGDTGGPGTPGVDGDNGLSAYDLWLLAGNSGTVNDYLASLKGAKGDTGTAGTNGTDGVKGDKGDTGATGPSGTSGALVTYRHVWTPTEDLSDFVADQGTSKAGLVIAGGFLTTSDANDHSVHQIGPGFAEGKVMVGFERIGAVNQGVVYAMLKYVDDNNFLMVQFDFGASNALLYQRIAGAYTSVGGTLTVGTLAVGDIAFVVGRISGNTATHEVWVNRDPRNGPSGQTSGYTSFSASTGYLLAGTPKTVLGRAVVGKQGLRLGNTGGQTAKISVYQASSIPQAPDAF